MRYSVINIEAGMPTVAQARIKLDQALRTERSRKILVVKIIHGYGSSGKGGAIKRDIQIQLSQKKDMGQIKEFVSGENFSPFNPAARLILAKFPELSKDSDYARGNSGITFVLL